VLLPLAKTYRVANPRLTLMGCLKEVRKVVCLGFSGRNHLLNAFAECPNSVQLDLAMLGGSSLLNHATSMPPVAHNLLEVPVIYHA